MSISTVFLQTTEENSNSFADTTFHIDLPMLQPTYKLSVASFMFRPSIVLGEKEYIKVKFKVDRDASMGLTVPDTFRYKFENGEWGEWKEQELEATIDIGTLQYSSGFDQSTLTELVSKKVEFDMVYRRIEQFIEATTPEIPPIPPDDKLTATVEKDGRTWFYDPTTATETTSKLTIEFVFLWTPQNRLEMYALKPLLYHGKTDKCYWNLTSFEITDISPALRHLTGITTNVSFKESNEKVSDKSLQVFKGVMTKPFNPQYWNYITLTCNKVYNTATIVNQTHYNTQANEATQFYKCQIMGYMVNQSPTQTYISTGVPTSNEYLITPADFNSIRFNLHFDNGEPVKLYSPMTIVLNISPV